MRAVAVILCCFLPFLTRAHPSWGISVNKNGEVFFVDVLHDGGTLWKINANGELVKVLSHFHAHDMFLDANEHIWLGEHLYIEGKIEGEGRHTLIKLNAQFEVDTLIETLDSDIFSGTAFAIGPDESIYFLKDKRVYQYQKGSSRLYIKHKFRNVKSILMDKEGALWITDSGVGNGTLYKYSNGSLQDYSSGLLPKSPLSPLFDKKHLQFLIGIAKDGDGNVYVSENSGCRILKINQLGEHSVFYQSASNWSPMNVAFYNGEAYIMEAGFSNGNTGPRIVKKSRSGAVSRLVNVNNVVPVQPHNHNDEGWQIPTWLYFAVGLLVFSFIIIFSVKKSYQS